MYFLSKETLRFNELQKKLGGLTAVTLSKHLQELEQKQLIVRQSYNQVPPKVEYSLSDIGKKFIPILDESTSNM